MAENDKAPRFFGGGLSRKGGKCLNMWRKREVAMVMEIGDKRKGAKMLKHEAEFRSGDGEGKRA